MDTDSRVWLYEGMTSGMESTTMKFSWPGIPHMCGWTATNPDALAAMVGVVFLSLLPSALCCSLVPSFTEGWAVEGAFPTQSAHTY